MLLRQAQQQSVKPFNPNTQVSVGSFEYEPFDVKASFC